MAVDESGQVSRPSAAVKARVVNKRRLAPVSNLNAVYNEENKTVALNWDYEEEGVRFQIYRNVGTDQVRRYKLVAENKTSFEDKFKAKETHYYAVKVIKKDGYKSTLSSIVSVSVE